MKKLLFALFVLIFVGCGYERLYIDIQEPFVIREIVVIEHQTIFKAEKSNFELNFGFPSQIVLSHDYGYRVGDTLRILDMRTLNEKLSDEE